MQSPEEANGFGEVSGCEHIFKGENLLHNVELKGDFIRSDRAFIALPKLTEYLRSFAVWKRHIVQSLSLT